MKDQKDKRCRFMFYSQFTAINPFFSVTWSFRNYADLV